MKPGAPVLLFSTNQLKEFSHFNAKTCDFINSRKWFIYFLFLKKNLQCCVPQNKCYTVKEVVKNREMCGLQWRPAS